MPRLVFGLLLLIQLLPMCPLGAQSVQVFPPPEQKAAVQAFRIEENLKIDGRLDELVWNRLSSTLPFTQVEPQQGLPAEQQTRVRVVYNQRFLYLGISAMDSNGTKSLRATDFKRDFSPRQHDHVQISVDGFKDGRNAMVFATNPYGVQRDLLSFDDLLYDLDWDGLWKVRTTRHDSGWVAEFAIPWETLRYPSLADSTQTWGINIARSRRASNELSTLSPIPRAFTPTRMDYAAHLTGLQVPAPGPNIRVQPYVLFSNDRYRTADGTNSTHHIKPGGELKWVLNPNTVLDLTANTDFAQADVDRQVNNVTRFSVFFPERRQFFLENASLFGFNISPSIDGSGGSMRIQPFFSRTIGLDGGGMPLPIQAGGRLVSRSSKENMGLMVMRQGAADSSPGTNFMVGRYSRNLGKQGRIGGLMTIKNQPGATNVLSTADAFFRLGESATLNGFLMHSVGGKVQKGALAGIAQYVKSTNTYKIWMTQSFVHRDFNPEMGFVSRSDIIGATPGGSWFYRGKYLPFKKMLRAFEPGILPEFYWQASTGRFIERQLSIFPIWFNFQNGGYIGYSINPVFQYLQEDFLPLGIRIGQGDYTYHRQQLWFSTDQSKAINFNTRVEWGTYFDGRLRSTEFQLQVVPNPHFSLITRINRNIFSDVGVAKESKGVNLYSAECRIAATPRLQFVGFYQRNSENQAANLNLRLAWEYQPLSYLYLVWNNRAFDDSVMHRQKEDHTIMKISFLKQI